MNIHEKVKQIAGAFGELDKLRFGDGGECEILSFGDGQVHVSVKKFGELFPGNIGVTMSTVPNSNSVHLKGHMHGIDVVAVLSE